MFATHMQLQFVSNPWTKPCRKPETTESNAYKKCCQVGILSCRLMKKTSFSKAAKAFSSTSVNNCNAEGDEVPQSRERHSQRRLCVPHLDSARAKHGDQAVHSSFLPATKRPSQSSVSCKKSPVPDHSGYSPQQGGSIQTSALGVSQQ